MEQKQKIEYSEQKRQRLEQLKADALKRNNKAADDKIALEKKIENTKEEQKRCERQKI